MTAAALCHSANTDAEAKRSHHTAIITLPSGWKIAEMLL
jgi:hypothetical protein